MSRSSVRLEHLTLLRHNHDLHCLLKRRGRFVSKYYSRLSGKLYDMVHAKIFSLDPDYLLYPAHDYTGQSVTSVEEESKLNPRLAKSREEFVQIMNELKLSYPKKIDVSLPWNKVRNGYPPPIFLVPIY